MLMSIEDLPAYIHCSDCGNRHFLSLNKDIHGLWCIGYVEYETHTALLGMNECKTVSEAVVRMMAALVRYNKVST